MKKLPIRWSFKKYDRILYKTPKGKTKTFIYGIQTWYGHSLPDRSFRFFRGKLEFREPTISEIISKTYRTHAKALKEAVMTENPFLKALKKYNLKHINTGSTISEPIPYKN